MKVKFSATTPSSSSWLPSNIEQSRDPAEQKQAYGSQKLIIRNYFFQIR